MGNWLHIRKVYDICPYCQMEVHPAFGFVTRHRKKVMQKAWFHPSFVDSVKCGKRLFLSEAQEEFAAAHRLDKQKIHIEPPIDETFLPYTITVECYECGCKNEVEVYPYSGEAEKTFGCKGCGVYLKTFV